MLTNGGNNSLSDNSTGYVIEAMAVQFNKTHFTQKASSTPWIAIFPCTKNSPAGNSSDLIENAQKLGAHAILVYTEGTSIQFCSLTDNATPVTIPIYATELWHGGGLAFSDELDGLFATNKMNAIAANLTADFTALRKNGSVLTQSDVILARIPGIAQNVSVAVASASPTEAPVATKTPSSAVRGSAHVLLLLGSSMIWAFCN
ncbi:hypothetical protein DFH06DRAFT_1141455 [Mycena polygramma]|nr:hypothetical protein DFH06DRAFT_1141455 [Mycena polygramma]